MMGRKDDPQLHVSDFKISFSSMISYGLMFVFSKLDTKFCGSLSLCIRYVLFTFQPQYVAPCSPVSFHRNCADIPTFLWRSLTHFLISHALFCYFTYTSHLQFSHSPFLPCLCFLCFWSITKRTAEQLGGLMDECSSIVCVSYIRVLCYISQCEVLATWKYFIVQGKYYHY